MTTPTHDEFNEPGQSNPHAAPLPKGLVLAISVLAVFGAVGAGASVMAAVSSRAQRQSDTITSCRTSFSSELVTGPTAAALQAIALYGIDSQQFEDEVTRADPQKFQDLTVLSRTDPGEFLRVCKKADLADPPA